MKLNRMVISLLLISILTTTLLGCNKNKDLQEGCIFWFEFFSMLPEEEELMTKQQETVYATFSH